MNVIPLGVAELAGAALLLSVNAGASLALSLGIGRRLAISALRMVVQLSLMGLVLEALFAIASPWLVLAAATVMVLFAGHEVAARQSRPLAGLWTYGIGTLTMLLTGFLVTGLALTALIGPDPWYTPRYALPLLGMVLGNTMNGISLGLDRLLAGAARERVAVEARLALGHSRWEAMRPLTREAVRAGMTNIINAMAAAGVVSLPGMMTGQILAGTPPAEAVKYQMLIMFLIAGATGLGVLLAVHAGVARLTDERDRLRLDRLDPSRTR